MQNAKAFDSPKRRVSKQGRVVYGAQGAWLPYMPGKQSLDGATWPLCLALFLAYNYAASRAFAETSAGEC